MALDNNYGVMGALLLLCGCGDVPDSESAELLTGDEEAVREITEPIYNGFDVNFTNKTVVEINGSCSGSIIARDAVLTAAHCFSSSGTKTVSIRIQSSTGSTKKCITPGWTSGSCGKSATVSRRGNGSEINTDVAVIKFSSSFSGLSKSDMPYLEKSSSQGAASVNGVFFGYGKTCESCSFGTLHGGEWLGAEDDGEVHNTAGESASCGGDSGGVVRTHGQLGIPQHNFGVNTGHFGDCDSGHASSFGAQVKYNLAWIVGRLPSGRCSDQSFTPQTPPPQNIKTLTRCY